MLDTEGWPLVSLPLPLLAASCLFEERGRDGTLKGLALVEFRRSLPGNDLRQRERYYQDTVIGRKGRTGGKLYCARDLPCR